MEIQKTLNSQSNLEKEQTGGINLPDFRLYYKAMVIKTIKYSMVLAQRQKVSPYQWNKIKSPEINPHIYGHLNFDEGGKNIQ